MTQSTHHPLEGADGVFVLTHRLDSLDIDPVREGARYDYDVEGLDDVDVLSVEPTELFTPRARGARSGTFAPRENVGAIDVAVSFADGSIGRTTVDVAPVKLDHPQYTAMLTQIADRAAEAVLQGFAPAHRFVGVDATTSGELSYRTLAYIAARLNDPYFSAALERIRHDPHRTWAPLTEQRPVGAGVRATSGLARALARSRPERDAPLHLAHLGVDRLPRTLPSTRHESTFDTPPNRFARYALQRWRDVGHQVLRALSDPEVGGSTRRRGTAEATAVIERCDELLRTPALRDAGPMRALPVGDTVLLRRPGYRDLLRAYALAECVPALHVHLEDDVFRPTLRNVATLYELWTFLVLADCISEVMGQKSPEQLRRVEDGPEPGPPSRERVEPVVDGRCPERPRWHTDHRGGALLQPDLLPRSHRHRLTDGTWARQMRPDASLRLRPVTATPAIDARALDTWVHFDAKYKVETVDLGALLEDDVELRSDEIDTPSSTPPSKSDVRRDDLLKMHAYRDAIRRTGGAYVLYPGDSAHSREVEYQEVLPGLGAFPLRPVGASGASGSEALTTFIRDLVAHVANQASAAERDQFWAERHALDGSAPILLPVPFVDHPPADAPVLVGHVRSAKRAWFEEHHRYVLRASERRAGAVEIGDSRLVPELLVLWSGDIDGIDILGVWGRLGPWSLVDDEAMKAEGYPGPHGPYWRCDVELLDDGTSVVSTAAVAALVAVTDRYGDPVATRWDKVGA